MNDKGFSLSAVCPVLLGKQVKRTGLPAEVVQNKLDKYNATPMRDMLLRGDGTEWAQMTRAIFFEFARTPDFKFKYGNNGAVGYSSGLALSMEIEFSPGQFGGLTMAQFLKCPEM